MSVRLLLASSLLLLAHGCKDKSETNGRPSGPLRVAAASDLAVAFKDVGAAFEKQSGKKVEFSFGSSGMLAKQIEEGAPFDVFAAANSAFVDDTVKTGSCLGDTKQLYARGHLVLWSKDPRALPKDIHELKDPKYAKIAIANPEHAPYGKAAQQALTKAGIWEDTKARMVYGENVQQTLMFARSQNADIAIVGLALAISSPGNWVAIDENLYEPLDQALVACKGGTAGAKSSEAREFIAFIGSPEGHAIMKKYGFLLPGEEMPQR